MSSIYLNLKKKNKFHTYFYVSAEEVYLLFRYKSFKLQFQIFVPIFAVVFCSFRINPFTIFFIFIFIFIVLNQMIIGLTCDHHVMLLKCRILVKQYTLFNEFMKNVVFIFIYVFVIYLYPEIKEQRSSISASKATSSVSNTIFLI